MASGTLTVPTRTWLSGGTLPINATALMLSYSLPQTRTSDDASTPSNCCDSVVIELSTTVTIDHFQRYYDVPIDSFSPNYVALADGSLVNPPLVDDIKAAAVKLAVIAALSVFFLMNTLKATRYIFRGLVKNKTLLYLLLSSQTLGLVAMISMLVPFFNSSASCTVTMFLARILIILSYAMLMTGILGIKAYRCLNNSRIIVVTLFGIRAAIFAMLALDLSRLRSSRRLSVGCMVDPEPKFLPIMVTLQFVEALFICACFLFAAWKALRRPVDHGRLSIEPTLDIKQYSNRLGSDVQYQQNCRGWWDYEPPQSNPVHSKRTHPCQDFFRDFFVRTGCYRNKSAAQSKEQKQSLSVSQPPRITVNLAASSPSHRSSVVSRLSKYMPRMTLFKQLVQDELLNTALITSLLLATAVLMLIGTACKIALEPPAWITLNWAVASMLTMHSFSRVVRRHEMEAILHHPASWDPVYRAQLEASRSIVQDRARRAVSTISRHPRWREDQSEHRLHGIRSVVSILVSDGATTAPLPSQRALRASYAASATSCEQSSVPAMGHTPNRHDNSVVMPQASPTYGEYPSPSVCSDNPDSPCSEVHIVRPASA